MNWSRVKVALLLVCGTMSNPYPNPDRNMRMRSEFNTEPKFTPTRGLKKKTRVNYHKVQKVMLKGEGQGRGPHPSSSRCGRGGPLLTSLFATTSAFSRTTCAFVFVRKFGSCSYRSRRALLYLCASLGLVQLQTCNPDLQQDDDVRLH